MAETTKTKYFEGVGRRKTASARVRLTPASSTTILINNKEYEEYFRHLADRQELTNILETEDAGIENYSISVKVSGGGLSAQAEAIKLGIARALVKEKANRRTVLKQGGFLKRDSRSVERKKFGLLKARKRPTWSKR